MDLPTIYYTWQQNAKGNIYSQFLWDSYFFLSSMQTLHLLDISYLKTQLMETLFCLFYQDLRMNNETKLLSECTVRCCQHYCHGNILSTLFNCKLVWFLLEYVQFHGHQTSRSEKLLAEQENYLPKMTG